MVIKRFTGMLGGKGENGGSSSTSGGGLLSRISGKSSNDRRGSDDAAIAHADTPEGNIVRGIRLFCESGGPENAGEEVLHLPTIVEAAESSPAAAAAGAQQIRKFLSKDHYSRPHVQYNAVMLIRILADNPGPTFTRNVDSKFISTTKELLRNCKDPSVQQIIRETLSALYIEKAYDNNLQGLFTMWNKEQDVPTGRLPHRRAPPEQNNNAQRPKASARPPNAIPPPQELAARIEEARTSAKLLQQLVQSTPPSELQSNDLVKEFADRCQAAQRSIQNYINCDNPGPDDDTMQTLIETSEQLSLASSKHSRAVLQARRANSQGNSQVTSPVTTPPATDRPVPPLPSHMTGYGAVYNAAPPPVPQDVALIPSDTTAQVSPINHQFSAAPPVPFTPTSPTRSANQDIPIRSAPNPDVSPVTPPRHRPSKPEEPQDNPFADAHAHDDDHDDLYTESPIATRPRVQLGDATTYVPGNTSSPSRPAPAPVPGTHLETWRKGDASGAEQSYAPGYTSTPSYLHRQESSGDHLTMHGAGSPPSATPAEKKDEVADSPLYLTSATGGLPLSPLGNNAQPQHPRQQQLAVNDGNVHRSNTLSTIMSESEYAASQAGGHGR